MWSKKWMNSPELNVSENDLEKIKFDGQVYKIKKFYLWSQYILFKTEKMKEIILN